MRSTQAQRWRSAAAAAVVGVALVTLGAAPPEPSASSVSPRTVLHTIGSWTDTQGTTHWRLMRWKERPQP